MASIDPLPQARVVREAGQRIAAPPVPPSPEPTWLGGAARAALDYAVGLWPLTCVMLLVAGLLVVTANLQAP